MLRNKIETTDIIKENMIRKRINLVLISRREERERSERSMTVIVQIHKKDTSLEIPKT